MGCAGGFGVDPEIAKILASLDDKIEDFNKTFIEDSDKAKKEFEEVIESRHSKLEECKKNQERITEEMLKDLNKKELEKEIDILSNILDKMHYIFEIGLELVEPIRKVTLDKLEEKAKTAPEIALVKIKAQIEEIKSYPIIDFLYSTYGKVLRDALTKKGLSETLLIGFKKDIMKKRKERREAERKEFDIKVNEFEDENIEQLNLDLMSLIKSEYKEIDKHYKRWARDKMIEALFSSK